MAATILITSLAAQSPRFETAAISPSHASGKGYSGHVERKPGQPVKLTLRNVTLQFCIQQAFAAKEYQVTGPKWIRSARYDITATLVPGAAIEQVWPALQTLLAERFELSMRREKRELLFYAMSVAAGGPKMHAAAGAGPKALSFQPGGPQEIGRSGGRSSSTMRLSNISIAEFCDRLSQRANHPVVNRTGVAGSFDFDFEFGGTSSTAMSRALEKQLGLKLEPVKDAVEMLIVESARRQPAGE